MGEQNETPKLAIVTVGKSTHVFLDGRCISEGLTDLKYSARNAQGEICPTLNMQIDVDKFSLDKGYTLDDFINVTRNREKLMERLDQDNQNGE